MAKANTQTAEKTKPASTEVAAFKKTELANNDLAAMYAADAGTGMEEATADSFAIPFLLILQKGSPQVDETMGQALPGAKAGMFYNNVTGELLDGKEGITIVPCHFKRDFIRWGPREGGGGGFKGIVPPEQVADMRMKGKLVDLDGGIYYPEPDGSVSPKRSHRVGDHRNHYVIYRSKDGNLRRAVMSLTSTQIRKSKHLMSLLTDVRMEDPKTGAKFSPAAYANQVKATTIGEQNDKGTWFGVKFEMAGFTDHETYQAGRQFYQQIKSDSVTVKYEDVDAAAPTGGSRDHLDEDGKAF